MAKMMGTTLILAAGYRGGLSGGGGVCASRSCFLAFGLHVSHVLDAFSVVINESKSIRPGPVVVLVPRDCHGLAIWFSET
jgi:hypothetical protein